jgi:hypothetical protein
MAITKEVKIAQIEVVQTWAVQVATDTSIIEDGKVISVVRHRHVLLPFSSHKSSDNKWTHTATDISKEEVSVRAIANAAWTNDVKTKYKEFIEAQEI